MNKVANKQVICDVLMEHAASDKDIIVLCSDSRGSSSMTPFAEQFPAQFVETGIAEQNLVSIAAGLASCGKKPYVASPACFLSTRSMEQGKVDVAYSHTNVKLVGVSGGVSYGALGMTHHSAQDIATMGSIPGMRVYLPSDRHQTRRLMEALFEDQEPAYIRTGRNAVEDVYAEDDVPFEMNRATVVTPGTDLTIIACGEMVLPAKQAAEELAAEGISVRVLDMYCIKPIDEEAVIRAAEETRGIITIEEHGPVGGLAGLVSQIVTTHHPVKMSVLSLPDAPCVAGKSQEIFDHYGLNVDGLIRAAKELLS